MCIAIALISGQIGSAFVQRLAREQCGQTMTTAHRVGKKRQNQCENVHITHWTRSLHWRCSRDAATGRVPRVWRQSCTHTHSFQRLLRFGVHSIVHTEHQHFCCAFHDVCKVHSKKGEVVIGEGLQEENEESSDKTKFQEKMCFVCLPVWLLDTNFLFTCTTSTTCWHWLTC